MTAVVTVEGGGEVLVIDRVVVEPEHEADREMDEECHGAPQPRWRTTKTVAMPVAMKAMVA